jgi:hypothetical protein
MTDRIIGGLVGFLFGCLSLVFGEAFTNRNYEESSKKLKNINDYCVSVDSKAKEFDSIKVFCENGAMFTIENRQ